MPATMQHLSSWQVEFDGSPASPASRLRALILADADAVDARREAMDDFIGDRRGHAGIAATLHPAFKELVRDFAHAFHELTEAVDSADHARPPVPWRDLIASRMILAGLDAGIAASNELVVARAVRKFLAENPNCLEPH